MAEDDGAAAQPFPVRLTKHRSRGRELVASDAVAAGGVVLRCLPLALAPADCMLAQRCAACLSSAAERPACACGYRLCARCSRDARWAAVHAAGECVSLQQLWTLLGRGAGGATAAAAPAPAASRKRARGAAPTLDATAASSDSAALRVLLRLSYERALEQRGGGDDVPPPAADCPHGNALRDDCDAASELLSHFDALDDAQVRAGRRALACTCNTFCSWLLPRSVAACARARDGGHGALVPGGERAARPRGACDAGCVALLQQLRLR